MEHDANPDNNNPPINTNAPPTIQTVEALISPEGIGFLGMIINFFIAILISSVTTKPPIEVGNMVDKIRLP